MSLERCHCAALVLVWVALVKPEPRCDRAEFLGANGTCAACPVCGPGEQLSEDCGFGDGGGGACVACAEGRFSADTGVAPCRRCTRCRLLNRLQRSACVPSGDAQCGPCLPGYYELRSITGEVELPCVPCYSRDTVHKACLTAPGSHTGRSEAEQGVSKEPGDNKVKEEPLSMVLIGPATASSLFFVALLLWLFLWTSETFKQAPDYGPGSEGPLPPAGDLITRPSDHAEAAEVASMTPPSAAEPPRGAHSPSHDNEVLPTSIVINVTTNIKPSAQSEEKEEEEEQQCCRKTTEEMEQQLQTIWEVAQGQSVEALGYDSVQDLSLLLDSADNRPVLRRLGQSLGVPPRVIAHLRGFQDLFQYLRTSTYTLLPHVAQAAALLPSPEVVAKIHHAVVNRDRTS
ncbi:tumor necrosis factor receptor superfamily member EDAR-like [Betta splendens]|uniref:Tumor necrosis factor receptor superfamily member EDAR-like n=1 Tax=Betta splendens TaxID=158456 RepID=A0A6P7NKA8_BETSP|nr:tumor necrosis factor receptor superfamily member EDAR-like [Betta splendens]